MAQSKIFTSNSCEPKRALCVDCVVGAPASTARERRGQRRRPEAFTEKMRHMCLNPWTQTEDGGSSRFVFYPLFSRL